MPMIKTTFTFAGVELQVEGYYTHYQPAVPYLPNGDPGYPEEGGGVDEVTVFAMNSKGFLEDITDMLSEKCLGLIIAEVLQKIEEKEAGDE